MRHRLIRYIMAGLGLAMLLGSCSEDLDRGGEISGEKGYITLRFVLPKSAVVETRATEHGDDLLNENSIRFVDLYFYPTGKSGENAALVEENHAIELDTSGGDTTYTVRVRTGDVMLNNIFGSTQNGSCEVYAIANSSAVSPSSSTALDSLRLRVLRHNFGARIVQENFVMQSNPETLATVTLKDGVATGTIPMTRVASKLQLYLNVPDTLHIMNEDGSNFAVWKSDREHMNVTFNDGLMDYTLNGLDTTHPDSSFYNSLQLDMSKYTTITKNEVGYDYSHSPFYSYPYSWGQTDTHLPTFIIAVPWSKLNLDGTYGTPETTYYQLRPNMSSGTLQSNYFYRFYMKIETVGSADNSTPIDITPSGYRIQPWGDVKLNTPRDVTGEFYRYTYLVVDPTSVILNNSSSTVLRYSSSSALTSDTKIISVEYNSYETAGQVTHHTLDADQIAALTSNKYELDYTSTAGQITFTHNVDDGTYAAKTITIQVANDDGLSELVTITQYPAIYMHTFMGDNVFVDGYFSHVADPASSIGDAISNWYSSGYYNSVNYGNIRTSGGSYYTYYQNTQNVTVPYGSMVKALAQTSGGIVNNSITEITVTSFNSNNGFYEANGTKYYYQIGDPRTNANYSSSDLQPYLTKQEYDNYYGVYWLTLTSWGDNAAKIKKASNTKTIIAPQFFVSSGWNSSTSVTFANAQKRAATYQEAGYSAGRWRLPTEAEIMFITARQREGVIPVLFAMDSSSNYWASSGRLYRNGQFYDASSNAQGYMRFVYDTWYWGDTAGDVTYYHPEP